MQVQSKTSKWGYTQSDGTPCKRCGYPCHNQPCNNCGGILCEPCFQYATVKEGYKCCEGMRIIDPTTGSDRTPDIGIRRYGSLSQDTNTRSMPLPMNPHLYTLQCSNAECLYRATFGKYPEPTLQYKAEYKFCPVCGHAAETIPYDNDKYWRLIGRTFEIPSSILREVYKEWTLEERQSTPSFREFVHKFMESE